MKKAEKVQLEDPFQDKTTLIASMKINKQNKKNLSTGASTKCGPFIRGCIDKNEEHAQIASRRSFTRKYHFMRVIIDKNRKMSYETIP